MVFKFEAPTSSSTLSFGPSTPSRGMFTFGQSSSRTSNNNNESGSSNTMSEIDGVCDLLHNMSTADNEDSIISTCANCGKEGINVTNTCNKCNMVKYCNVACKKKHRSKHKKKCERRVAELHDEQLFKPPPIEDCPICFLRLPSLESASVYMSCCGKVVCCGCMWAVQKTDAVNICRETQTRNLALQMACIKGTLCPFCRTPVPKSDREIPKRFEQRIDVGNDNNAFRSLGCLYFHGECGLPQNREKALELFHRAGELGNSSAYYSIGRFYWEGVGVEQDGKMALHYFALAAIGGEAAARWYLGFFEEEMGTMDRALKHYKIGVECGDRISLKQIKRLYMNKQATKDDYDIALRSYQAYVDEIKSDQRDEAAAFDDRWKYYE